MKKIIVIILVVLAIWTLWINDIHSIYLEEIRVEFPKKSIGIIGGKLFRIR